MRATLIACSAVAAMAFAVRLSAQTPADSPQPLPTDAPAPAPADAPIISRCLVSAIDDAQVSAKEAGVITTINVHEGQLVMKGELLAQIDDAQPQMEKRKAMAEKNAAEVKANSDIEKRFDVASAEVSRFDYLRKLEANGRVRGAVTDTEIKESELKWIADKLKIEQADLELKIAKLTVDDKQAEVDAADEAINRRQIRAPQDGVIEQIVPHVGEWVKPGDSVIRLVRIDRLQVEGFLRGDAYNPWEVRDRPVTVFVKLARQTDPVAFTGRITFVDPLKEAGNSFRVKASVENRLAPGRKDEWLLHPGDTATMRIDLN
ncbi:MAG TPA: HlyD family efflux transporter periplasmic adaptor subunit [Pirellulales bacterium]|nr:HlyD family efflux transporter periplasmic adaptor subunit [Pirellulales bacterium]